MKRAAAANFIFVDYWIGVVELIERVRTRFLVDQTNEIGIYRGELIVEEMLVVVK